MKEDNEVMILCGTTPVFGDELEKKCFKCGRKLYTGVDTEAETLAQMPGAVIKYACIKCAREAWGKELEKNIVVLESATETLGMPKETLAEMAKEMLEGTSRGIAG